MIVTLVNAFVVVAVGVVLGYITNERYKALRAEIAALRAEMRSELAEVRGEIARLEDRMDAGMNAIRSDLTRVALAVGAGGHAAEG